LECDSFESVVALRSAALRLFAAAQPVKNRCKCRRAIDNRGYSEGEESEMFSCGKEINSPAELREAFYASTQIPPALWGNQLNRWPDNEFKTSCQIYFNLMSAICEILFEALENRLELPRGSVCGKHARRDHLLTLTQTTG